MSATTHRSRRGGAPQRGRPSSTRPNITKQFGGLTAVNDVTFTLPEKSIVSIIGPNGAGKTTFFNILTGFYRPTLGTDRRSTGATSPAPGRTSS